jgi:hypothetical protein
MNVLPDRRVARQTVHHPPDVQDNSLMAFFYRLKFYRSLNQG